MKVEKKQMDRNGFANPKLLVLGGKPIGACELVQAAHDRGASVVVTDYLSVEDSPAKAIADEVWDLSTADTKRLAAACKDAKVSGVLSGVNEFNINAMVLLAEEASFPCYCTSEQQDICTDKRKFKALCREYGLPVAMEYSEEEACSLPENCYPLAIKPVDGSGSRGFSKCLNSRFLSESIRHAKEGSASGGILIEEYIDSEAMVVHYTAHNGAILFCGLTDKASRKKGSQGAPIMALQMAPSLSTREYLERFDSSVVAMLSSIGIEEGPVWIELFHRGEEFVFNEIGYRFGGSLTYHLVKELSGIDQLSLLLDYALGVKNDGKLTLKNGIAGVYAIWPIHLHAGRIAKIEGLDELKRSDCCIAVAQVHWEGDEIEDWGSARQVFAYVHLKAGCADELIACMADVFGMVHVYDEDGADMLYALFDPAVDEQDCSYPDFLRQRLNLQLNQAGEWHE